MKLGGRYFSDETCASLFSVGDVTLALSVGLLSCRPSWTLMSWRILSYSVSSHLQPLYEGGMLRRRQSLSQHVHDCCTVELQQSIGMEPESWKDT